MTTRTIYLHIDRLVVDESFNYVAFEQALMHSFSQPGHDEWVSRKVERLDLPFPAHGKHGRDAAATVAKELRSIVGKSAVKAKGDGRGW